MHIRIDRFEVVGANRLDRDGLESSFNVKEGASVESGSLSKALHDHCQELVQMNLIKPDYEIRIAPAGERGPGESAVPCAVSVVVGERKFSLSTGTEIQRGGDVGIKASGAAYGLFGSGCTIRAESSVGNRSRVPFWLSIASPFRFSNKNVFSVDCGKGAFSHHSGIPLPYSNESLSFSHSHSLSRSASLCNSFSLCRKNVFGDKIYWKQSLCSTLTYSSLNDPVLPTKGIRLHLSNDLSIFRGDCRYWKCFASLKSFSSAGWLAASHSFKFGRYFPLSAESCPLDLFSVGGDGSVRGIVPSIANCSPCLFEYGASLLFPLSSESIHGFCFYNFALNHQNTFASVGFGAVAKIGQNFGIECSVAFPFVGGNQRKFSLSVNLDSL